jgi:phage terminase small subunit
MNISQIPDGANEDLQDDILSTALTTHNGQRLSPKEDRFISLYIKYADAAQAAKEAGYTVRAEIKNKEAQYIKIGKKQLAKDYVRDEIAYRSEEFRNTQIADTNEILKYLTDVMRGNIKDQFNLDASLAERTSAAKELNRRLHELETATESGAGKEVHLVLRRE